MKMSNVVTFLVALMVVCCFTSCEGTVYLEEIETQAPTPTDSYSTRILLDNYSAVFDTAPQELFTVEQTVEGYLVEYKNGEEVSSEPFENHLNLKAVFSELQALYVSDQSQLSTVELKEKNTADASENSEECGIFEKTIVNKNYSFLFDCGEVVNANALYESLKKADLDYVSPYAEIADVSFYDFSAVKNETKSCKDSLVYDVALRFNVDLAFHNCEKQDASYIVEVPYEKIYKFKDEFVGKSYRDVTRKVIDSNTEEITWTEVETWTVSEEKTTTKSYTLHRNFSEPELQWIYTDNSQYITTANESTILREEAKTDGNWKVTTRYMQYTSTANNGSNPFKNVYKYDYQSAVYSDEYYTLTFDFADWTINEGESTVSSKSSENTVDGVKYDVYDYTNNISTLYTISNEKFSDSASSLAKIAIAEVIEVKLENETYEGLFDTKTAELYTVRQNNSIDIVTYKNGSEIERENWVGPINLEAIFGINATVVVDSEEALTTVKMTSSSFGADVVKNSTEGNFTKTSRSLNYSFGFNEGEKVTSKTLFEKMTHSNGKAFEYASIENVSYKSFEANPNANLSTKAQKVVDVILYFNVKVSRKNSSAATRSSETETYTVGVPYQRVFKVKDEMTGKSYQDVKRTIIDANTEEISWTDVENWTVSGEKKTQMSYKLYRHLSGPASQFIYTSNKQYNTTSNGSAKIEDKTNTDGNWKVTTRYMQYTSTANNGSNPFKNVYKYDYQSAVYNNGHYTLTFDFADWAINEASSTISTNSTEKMFDEVVYNIYNYVNNINTVYTVSGGSYKLAAKSNVEIAVKKEIKKITPESWGYITGAGISAVPSDDVANQNYAKKCLCIRTTKGAVAVVFDMKSSICTENSILNGYFVEGNFDARYNSGYFTTEKNCGSYAVGKWAPARAQDESGRIAYYDGLPTPVRNIVFATLNMWNWRNGNLSTVVEGYTFSVNKDNVLNVYFNGTLVLQIK